MHSPNRKEQISGRKVVGDEIVVTGGMLSIALSLRRLGSSPCMNVEGTEDSLEEPPQRLIQTELKMYQYGSTHIITAT